MLNLDASNAGNNNNTKPESSEVKQEVRTPGLVGGFVQRINPFREKQNDILKNFMSVTNKVIDLVPGLKVVAANSMELDTGIDGALFGYTQGNTTAICYLMLRNTSKSLVPTRIGEGVNQITLTNFEQDIISDEKGRKNIAAFMQKNFGAGRKIGTVSLYKALSASAESEEFEKEVRVILTDVMDAITVAFEHDAVNDDKMSEDIRNGFSQSSLCAGILKGRLSSEKVHLNITREHRANMVLRDNSGTIVNPDVIFRSQVGGDSNARIFSGNTNDIIEVGVSGDLIRVGIPRQDRDGRIIAGQHAVAETQIYEPVLRIETSATSECSAAALPMMLITAMAPLSGNKAYLYPFMKTKADLKTSVQKLSHIGGIWSECAFLHSNPEKTAGHATEEVLALSDEDKVRILTSAIRDNPRILMTCSSLDKDYFLTAQLKNAAHSRTNGGISQEPGSKTAYDTIYRDSLRLCGDAFGKAFPYGTPISLKTNALRPIGTFSDKDGVQSINTKKYLYFLNLWSGKKEELESLDKWAEFMYGGNADSPRVRLERHINFLKSIDSTTEIVGYGEEIELNPAYISALISSYRSSGVDIQIPEIRYADQGTGQRATLESVFSSSWSNSVDLQRSNLGGGLSGGSNSDSFNIFG